MAHVRITQEPKGLLNYSVVVDGVGLSDHIYAEGFAVNFPSDPNGEVYISCRLVVESFDLDIADAAFASVEPRRLCDPVAHITHPDPTAARALIREVQEINKRLERLNAATGRRENGGK